MSEQLGGDISNILPPITQEGWMHLVETNGGFVQCQKDGRQTPEQGSVRAWDREVVEILADDPARAEDLISVGDEKHLVTGNCPRCHSTLTIKLAGPLEERER